MRRKAAVNLPKGAYRVISRGKEYYYFQLGRNTASAGPNIRLPDDPHSPEFWTALRKAQGESGAEETIYTVESAIAGYLGAINIAPETHYRYRRSLDHAKAAWGGLPVDGLLPKHVAALMKTFASKPHVGNHFLGTMKSFGGWCLANGHITQGFTEGVKPFKVEGGHKPWTPEQIAAIGKLPSTVRRGVMLYLYTGQRGQDVVRLGPTMLDDGGFDLKQLKTKRDVWCPVLPELAAEMATWERRPGPYLLQANGKPYTRRMFWRDFDKARETIPELADVTLHGLRCTAVINLRRGGLSVPQISDIVGMSLATVQRYCRFADKKESGKAALLMLAEHKAKGRA